MVFRRKSLDLKLIRIPFKCKLYSYKFQDLLNINYKKKYYHMKTCVCAHRYYIQQIYKKKCCITLLQSDGSTGKGVFGKWQYTVNQLQATMTFCLTQS